MCKEEYVEALIDWIWLAADREPGEVLSLKDLVGKALFTQVIAEVKGQLSCSFEWTSAVAGVQQDRGKRVMKQKLDLL